MSSTKISPALPFSPSAKGPVRIEDLPAKVGESFVQLGNDLANGAGYVGDVFQDQAHELGEDFNGFLEALGPATDIATHVRALEPGQRYTLKASMDVAGQPLVFGAGGGVEVERKKDGHYRVVLGGDFNAGGILELGWRLGPLGGAGAHINGNATGAGKIELEVDSAEDALALATLGLNSDAMPASEAVARKTGKLSAVELEGGALGEVFAMLGSKALWKPFYLEGVGAATQGARVELGENGPELVLKLSYRLEGASSGIPGADSAALQKGAGEAEVVEERRFKLSDDVDLGALLASPALVLPTIAQDVEPAGESLHLTVEQKAGETREERTVTLTGKLDQVSTEAIDGILRGDLPSALEKLKGDVEVEVERERAHFEGVDFNPGWFSFMGYGGRVTLEAGSTEASHGHEAPLHGTPTEVAAQLRAEKHSS